MDWGDYDGGALRPRRRPHADRRGAHARLAATVHRLPRRRAARRGRPYTDADYFDHVDGKPRYDGVRDFLASRGIDAARGRPVRRRRRRDRLRPRQPQERRLRRRLAPRRRRRRTPGRSRCSTSLRAPGHPVAVVSSSRNAPAVLAAAGLADRFPVIVDGEVAADARPRRASPRPTPSSTAPSSSASTPSARSSSRTPSPASPPVRAGRLRARRRRRPRRRRRGAAATRAPTSSSPTSPSCVTARRRRTPCARRDPLDRDRFPVDQWRLVETALTPTTSASTETLFTVANGYLGMRGNARRGPRRRTRTAPSSTASTRPGRSATPRRRSASPRSGRRSSTSPTPRSIRLYVDDEPLVLDIADLSTYERGARLPRRRAAPRAWSGAPRRASGSASSPRRMVSFTQRHLAVHDLRGHRARPPTRRS